LDGDIITGFPAIIQGGLGIAAGVNINPSGASMLEPPRFRVRVIARTRPGSVLLSDPTLVGILGT
jgi:isocitrate dehydrogenase